MFMKTLPLAVMIGLGASSAFAQDGPLRSELTSAVISVGDDGREVREVTETVSPGDAVEYTLTYSNVGNAALSGIVISAPVPADTTYIGDSERSDQPARFEASIDGGNSWAVPPLMRETVDGERTVPPSEYDAVRWVPEQVLSPENSWTFTYRVDVN